MIAGIDLNEAMAALPPDLDPGLTRNLLIAAEGAYVAAVIETSDQQETKARD